MQSAFLRCSLLAVLGLAACGPSGTTPSLSQTPQLTPGLSMEAVRPTASSTKSPTIYAVTQNSLAIYEPPYGKAPFEIPLTSSSQVAVGDGNVFISNGSTVQEYIHGMRKGRLLRVQAPVTHLAYGSNGTLLVEAGSFTLYAYPQPYVQRHIVHSGGVTIELQDWFATDDSGRLTIFASSTGGVLTTVYPYTSLTVATKKRRLIRGGFGGIDPTTSVLYTGMHGYAFPYRQAPPVWHAAAQQEFGDFRQCGGDETSANVGIVAYGEVRLDLENCSLTGDVYVFRPPSSYYVSHLENLFMATVGGDGDIYGFNNQTAGAGSLVRYSLPNTTPVALGPAPSGVSVSRLIVP